MTMTFFRCRRFILVFGLGTSVGFRCMADAQPAGQADKRGVQRPNIIFLLTDDQGWGDAACWGHPYYKTPNLDRLTREGTVSRSSTSRTPSVPPAAQPS